MGCPVGCTHTTVRVVGQGATTDGSIVVDESELSEKARASIARCNAAKESMRDRIAELKWDPEVFHGAKLYRATLRLRDWAKVQHPDIWIGMHESLAYQVMSEEGFGFNGPKPKHRWK